MTVQITPDVDTVLEAVRDGLFVRFAQVAAGTLFAYDVLLNLNVEFKYVWAALNPRNRPVKISSVVFNLMYLVQRYLPLWDRIIMDTYYILGPSDTKSCEITYEMSAWSTIIGIHLSEFILAMRIWAVWVNKPSVMVMLVTLAASVSIPALLFFVRFVRGIQCRELHMLSMLKPQGCFCSSKNKDLYVSWSMLMVINTVGFILMAIPGLKAYRRGGRSNLMKVVYQDGVIYYASIFMASLINIVIILRLPSSFVIMVSPLEHVIHSILASHVVLHIRKVAYVQNGDMLNGITMIEELENTEVLFAPNVLRSDTEPENQRNCDAETGYR
ncbi:hypothetical protein E1B28_010669 [Marasmius oreades]|uniref:DUF6533 domain-containing protein n=1 Tax=Marasmius oreades TaxID=181124 RepID=A0A9P7RZ38_9AGAR|nr:uncharacterized protein E1B28_010669 [Marasmius oreades]KAG7091648.1 hypothetical protein E1B28_010669 [Marasmius oreades]